MKATIMATANYHITDDSLKSENLTDRLLFSMTLTLIQPASKSMHLATLRQHSDLF